MRGRKMSSANFVWPVHLARASTLRKGLPTTFIGLPLLCPLFDIQNLVRQAASLSISGRLTACRTKDSFQTVDTLARQFHLFPAHARRGQLDCFINLDVAGAAAKIPR